ncbi:MAG: hypothetical protein Greene041614_425 [Parcubacteria group bacterium Greene0416_14]|nr:MAG: hypothetical protein Greene041614_425 [Parcubacteria group bacterium Greene0416_14]TSD00945.1 MAG: hypothetical protein Greene101415_595 [Parcubacteria group bacterium Greene1014_15]
MPEEKRKLTKTRQHGNSIVTHVTLVGFKKFFIDITNFLPLR